MTSLIEEDNVSSEVIKELFDRAFFKATIDSDSDVYVTEGLEFPIWISVRPEQKLLCFTTYVRRETEGAAHFLSSDANILNQSIILARFYAYGDQPKAIGADYFMTFREGLLDSHVVAIARRFSGAFVAGVQQFEGQDE